VMTSAAPRAFAARDLLLVRLLGTRAAGLLALVRSHAESRRERDAARRLVAERDVAAAEARRAMHALERVEAQLEALFEAAPVGAAFLDTHLRYVRVNEALAALNGVPKEAHIGRTPREVVGPEIAASIEPHLEAVLATRKHRDGVEMRDPRGRGAEGAWLGSFYPIVLGDELVGVGVIVTDITAQKREEGRLIESAELRERFMGILGHDLKNPLGAITMATELLRRVGALSPQQAAIARQAEAAARRMGRMIEELLDFTRARLGGGFPVELADADVGEICRHVAQEVDAAVDVDVAPDLLCLVDADRLTQALANLVGNALEHVAASSTVTLRARADGAFVVFEVENEGAPIPPETLPYIFEPFRRGPPSQKTARGNLGLGLYIAREIAKAHGGQIHVRSDSTETAFAVRLPRRATPSSPATHDNGGINFAH